MIKMYREKQVFVNGKWIVDPAEKPISKQIDADEFRRITCKETIAWFRALGGTEYVENGYGGIVKLISTSPDRSQRVVYTFAH